jgi:hypothetical protein
MKREPLLPSQQQKMSMIRLTMMFLSLATSKQDQKSDSPIQSK